MSVIINRTPTGRLISLHSELRYLYARFRDRTFDLNDMKYDESQKYNPLMFFPLIKKDNSIGVYDPYLDNPLSPAKFHLTQSIDYDKQKSKSASECLNALEALGWADRINGKARVSPKGIKVSQVSFQSKDFLEYARSSVLGYGVFVGFLYKCREHLNIEKIINKSDIQVGYVNTKESILENGKSIPLSTGSQKDTIVRTRSTLFAWAISTGFALPISLNVPDQKDLIWQNHVSSEINNKHWGWSKLRMFIPKAIFDGSHYVDRPLSYKWMTKSTKALRERGQRSIRHASLTAEAKIKNRRFAIVFCLGLASKFNKRLNFEKLVRLMSKEPDYFVIDSSNFEKVMQSEKDIAIASGIPFVEKSNILCPLTKINLDYLCSDAPQNLVSLLSEISKEVSI